MQPQNALMDHYNLLVGIPYLDYTLSALNIM